MSFSYTQTDTESIGKTIEAIRPVVADMDGDVICMACIAIAVLMHSPKIPMVSLIATVKQVSEQIALLTMEVPSESVN